MSSIDALNGTSSNLPLSQLLARQATGAVRQFQKGADQDFEARFNAAALAAGLDPQAVGGLQEEIQSALDAATQNSDSTTDRRQVVQNAIDGVLQKHGVDLAKFKSQMQSMGGPGGPGGAGGPPPGGGPPGGAQGADFQAKFKDAAVSAGLDAGDADSLQDEINAAIDQVLKNSDEETDPRQAIQDAIDKLLADHGVDLDAFKSELQSSLGGTSSQTIPLIDTQA
jgi:hypothetical protein